MPLKSGLRVIQGHWKWRHSIDPIRLCHCNYSYIVSLFSSYNLSDVQNMATLKSRLGVTQGHWKWHHSIDRIRVSISLPLYNYGRILYRYQSKILIGKCQFSYPLYLTCTIPYSRVKFFPKILIQSVQVSALLSDAKILSRSSTLWVACTKTSQMTDDRRTADAIFSRT